MGCNPLKSRKVDENPPAAILDRSTLIPCFISVYKYHAMISYAVLSIRTSSLWEAAYARALRMTAHLAVALAAFAAFTKDLACLPSAR